MLAPPPAPFAVPPAGPTLHVVVRMTPGENRKSRPDWYSKQRCVSSLFAAVRHARDAGLTVHLTVALDVSSGRPLPEPARRLVETADDVLLVRGGTAATSWRPLLRALRRRPRPADDDLVYLVEDDHLHLPTALVQLVDGADEYRLLYALASEHGRIRDRGDGWADVPGGTSSFAVSGRALREDRWRHLFFSCGGGPWDELTWRSLGSHATPPGLSYVLQPFTAASQWDRPWDPRALRHAVFRALALLAAHSRRRSIGLRLPIQAVHCESAMLTGTTDWAAVAAAAGEGSGRGDAVRATQRATGDVSALTAADAPAPSAIDGDA